jgi:hypothetical protein
MPRYLFALLLLSSCTLHPKPSDPEKWYRETKEIILSESSLPTDSTATEKYADGTIHKAKSYNHAHPTVEKWYRETGEQVVQTNFSRNGLFELRREICKDGKPGFEGIFFQGNAYGLSTWWRCGKSKEEEGIRYKDQKIGVWKTWDVGGKLSATDYGHVNLMDSLPWIREGYDKKNEKAY